MSELDKAALAVSALTIVVLGATSIYSSYLIRREPDWHEAQALRALSLFGVVVMSILSGIILIGA